MTRIVANVVLCIALLAACMEYREPQANCFNFVAPVSGEKACNFEPLGGPADGEAALD